MTHWRQFNRRFFTWFALLFFLSSGASFAQLEITLDTLDASGFPEIRLVFRVFDNGSAVQGLNVTNFTVFENGQIQAPINGGCTDTLFFTPSSIMLCIDRSGSIEAAFPAVQQAAKEFINGSSSQDEFAIFSFGGRGIAPFCPAKDISVESDWSTNRPALLNAIDDMSYPCGGTPLRETIINASNWFQGRMNKRIMVVLTDGDDSYPDYMPSEAINAAKANNVTVYTIGLGNEIDEQELSTLAAQTGGKYYKAPTTQQLSVIYDDISKELAPTGNCEIEYTCLLDCFDGSTVNVDIQVRSGGRTATARGSFQLPYDTTTFTYVEITANRNYVVEAGDEMVFPMKLRRVSTNRTSNNYEMDISYNKGLIELVDVQPTAITTGYATTFQETPTGATISLNGGPAIVDTGDVALLVFHAFESLESSKSEIGISTPRTGTECTYASANNGLITINGFCRRTLFPVSPETEQTVTTILPNSPNPFNPGTTVSYILGKDGKTTLKVYNALGEEITTLVNDTMPAGEYSMYFDATGLANGIYYLQLENNGDFAVRRMALLK